MEEVSKPGNLRDRQGFQVSIEWLRSFCVCPLRTSTVHLQRGCPPRPGEREGFQLERFSLVPDTFDQSDHTHTTGDKCKKRDDIEIYWNIKLDSIRFTQSLLRILSRNNSSLTQFHITKSTLTDREKITRK